MVHHRRLRRHLHLHDHALRLLRHLPHHHVRHLLHDDCVQHHRRDHLLGILRLLARPSGVVVLLPFLISCPAPMDDFVVIFITLPPIAIHETTQALQEICQLVTTTIGH